MARQRRVASTVHKPEEQEFSIGILGNTEVSNALV